jgi:hypothetical protein
MRRAGESLRTVDSPRPQRLFNRVILEGKKRVIGRIKTTIFILHEMSFGLPHGTRHTHFVKDDIYAKPYSTVERQFLGVISFITL